MQPNSRQSLSRQPEYNIINTRDKENKSNSEKTTKNSNRMYGNKKKPSIVWLLVQAAMVFCYMNIVYCKPYRQEIHQEDSNNNKQDHNKTIQVTNKPTEDLVRPDRVVSDPSLNSRIQSLDSTKASLKTAEAVPLHDSVIFKAIVSNVNVLTLQEENSSSNDIWSKHLTEIEQEHKDANGSSSSQQRLSKAHLKWDGHVVAAPLKYNPQVNNFQTPKKVGDTISTSKMVLSLLTAAAALGSICLTVAIFQCCCRRKRSSDDEDDDQVESDQSNKEKVAVKTKDVPEQQSVEQETTEKDLCIQQTDAPVETSVGTPTEQTITNGETVQKDSEEKEEEQVSVKDKIKAFETQALKPFSTENAEQHRTLIKRPHSRVSTDSESESLSASTTLIMGQVFRKRADTEKCQRKQAASVPEKTQTDDDYFGMIGRETEVLKSYRRAPAPRNRNKATKALYRKTMPIMESEGGANIKISISDWEDTVQSFHQTESLFGKQESKKKKTPLPLPLPNENAKDGSDNKLEDSTEQAEIKTEGSVEMETVSPTEVEKLGPSLSTGNNTPEGTSSSSDESSQEEEKKIKEEMKEVNEEEKEVEKVETKKEEEEEEEKEEEIKEKSKNEDEEEEKLKKEEKEKEKQKTETEEKEDNLKEEEKLKEEELNKEKKEKDEESEEKREVKKEKQLKELKREKDEVKREKEELNKEELKKAKEQLEKEGKKNENIFFQIDPTAEPTAAKLVKRDSGHESSEKTVTMRHSTGDSPKNDQSPKSRRHLSHLDRTTMFMLPGQKPEDQMSLMLSLKEKLSDKKEKNEPDADTDTKMDVDSEPETEKSVVPEC